MDSIVRPSCACLECPLERDRVSTQWASADVPRGQTETQQADHGVPNRLRWGLVEPWYCTMDAATLIILHTITGME